MERLGLAISKDYAKPIHKGCQGQSLRYTAVYTALTVNAQWYALKMCAVNL